VRGLLTTAGIWLVALIIANELNRNGRHFPSLRLNRERVAITLVLLATHAIAGRTSAEELLENPLAIERVARGALAGFAGLLILPLFASRLQALTQRQMPASLSLFGYVLVSLISITYSVAPVVTAGKVFELAVASMIVLTCLGGSDPVDGLKSMVRFVLFLEGVLLMTAVVGFFVMPSVFAQVQPRPGFLFQATMAAPYAHPNVLAASAGALSAFALANYLTSDRGKRAGWMTLYGGSLLGIVLASGRQGVVIWLVVTLILLARYRRTFLVTVVAPTVVVVLVAAGETIWRAVNRNALYDLRTLTGRLPWWQSAVEVWRDHPLTGYGFGAGGRFVALAAIGSRPGNVHSGYLEALVGVGLLGVIPFTVALILVAGWTVRSFRRGSDVPFAILIVPLALHTAIDLGFGAWLKPDFVILACLAGLCDMARRPIHLVTDVPSPKLLLAGLPDSSSR
jgi:O-antigen ligase